MKLFQKPNNDNINLQDIDNLIYLNKNILVVQMENPCTCCHYEILKKMKIRSLLISNFLFKRIIDVLEELGYTAQTTLTDEGDILKIRCTSLNNNIEILYCGVIIMDNFDLKIIDNFIPILLGDD
jgi:hypothetical protein